MYLVFIYLLKKSSYWKVIQAKPTALIEGGDSRVCEKGRMEKRITGTVCKILSLVPDNFQYFGLVDELKDYI